MFLRIKSHFLVHPIHKSLCLLFELPFLVFVGFLVNVISSRHNFSSYCLVLTSYFSTGLFIKSILLVQTIDQAFGLVFQFPFLLFVLFLIDVVSSRHIFFLLFVCLPVTIHLVLAHLCITPLSMIYLYSSIFFVLCQLL